MYISINIYVYKRYKSITCTVRTAPWPSLSFLFLLHRPSPKSPGRKRRRRRTRGAGLRVLSQPVPITRTLVSIPYPHSFSNITYSYYLPITEFGLPRLPFLDAMPCQDWLFCSSEPVRSNRSSSFALYRKEIPPTIDILDAIFRSDGKGFMLSDLTLSGALIQVLLASREPFISSTRYYNI